MLLLAPPEMVKQFYIYDKISRIMLRTKDCVSVERQEGSSSEIIDLYNLKEGYINFRIRMLINC
jgi:hypothetical protein